MAVVSVIDSAKISKIRSAAAPGATIQCLRAVSNPPSDFGPVELVVSRAFVPAKLVLCRVAVGSSAGDSCPQSLVCEFFRS